MGIGKAIARRFVEDDMHVVGVDWNSEELHATTSELGELVQPVVGDIGAWDTHERAAAAALENGPIAGWVNNAGIDISAGAHEVTAEQIDHGLRVLLLGPMYGTAIAVRSLLPQRSGSIVNIASIQGIVAFPGYFTYQAAKAGVIMISRGVAVDYGPYGIRCNAVCPGSIDTPMTRGTSNPDEVETILASEAQLAPLGRIGVPEDIAELVHFLVSAQSSFVTGATLVADGGATARCYAYPPLPVEAQP
jgi:NAD(P)-dependent dehydrogenase (short-subunit alcohol dehydrogenase family)